MEPVDYWIVWLEVSKINRWESIQNQKFYLLKTQDGGNQYGGRKLLVHIPDFLHSLYMCN